MPLRIIYEGDEAAAKSHTASAQNLLYKVRAFVAASGAGVYSSQLVLDDRSYVYCLKIGDTEVIHIFSLPITPYDPNVIIPFPELPDFLSGLVRNGVIRTDYIPKPGGGEKELRVLENFRPSAATAMRLDIDPNAYNGSARLAVKPSVEFADFQGSTGDNNPDRTVRREFSQYRSIRPSNYTGRMQALVQVVMGMGHIPENTVVAHNKRDREEIIREGVQVRYDCRYHRSHGLARGADGEQWLLEISNINGVLAMQLPRYPDSLYLKDSEYADIAAAVEEFQGLPTGQTFPTGDQLKAGIEAGTILRLLDPSVLAPYFMCQPYFSLCGWAFNTNGTEAHNTGWFHHEDGMIRSSHFSIDIQIGALKRERQPGDPIATATAKFRTVSTGRILHWDSKFPPPFKTHEPLVNGLVSFQMLPMRAEPDPYDLRVVCDATMFVYFADNQLKKVNYYYDRQTKAPVGAKSDFEECMYIGSWTHVTTNGPSFIPAMFYTSDDDDREAIDDNQTTINITGTDMGWFGPYVNDNPLNLHQASITRRRYFRQVQTTTTDAGISLSSGIVIPEGMREGHVYAKYRRTAASTTHKRIEYMSLTDPNTYQTYRLLYPSEIAAGRGCYTQERKVEFEYLSNQGRCAEDLANHGPWASICQTILEGPQMTLKDPPATSTPPVLKGSMIIKLCTGTQLGAVPLVVPTNISDEWVNWRWPSPDEYGSYQRMSAYHTGAIGELHMLWDTRLTGENAERRTHGRLLDGTVSETTKQSLNFIGVL